MRNTFLFILCFLLFFTNVLYAQHHTISGYVIDKETGETLIGVNVIVTGTNKGAATDGNGYFRIPGLEPGSYTLLLSYIGYEDKKFKVVIQNKSLILQDIAMTPQPVKLKEIIVTGERSQIADVEMEASHLQISPRAVKSIPDSRDDIFRAVKYLPGIEGIDPFSPLFSARGSDPGENLILLDGVTIYNPYHYTTATGIFNIYAIKNIEMLVGGFGAEYGGRNSSVLYITTREGNNKTLHGEMELTTTQSKFCFDFPLNKNATMMVSTRTYYDLIGRFLFNSPSYFYDMNITLNWKLNQQNRFSLRYFYSKDYFDYSFARFSSYFSTTFQTDIFDDYDVVQKNNWHNQAITAVLKNVISPKFYLQTQLSGSFFSSDNQSILDFQYEDEETDQKIELYYRTDIDNKIRDLGIKSVANFSLNSSNTLKFGLEYNQYYFNNSIQINYFGHGTATRKPDLLAGFIEDKIELGPISIRPGLRLSKYLFIDHWKKEPRISTVIQLPYNWQLKAAWGKYYQYIISINSQEYELSQYIDNYYPLKYSKPSASTHYILGFGKQMTNHSQLSVDLYYKDISRVYTFDSNVPLKEVTQFPDKLRQGKGKSYGLELLWRGSWQRFSGWISYGISRSMRSYPHIMDGKSFLFDYDRTHTFKAVLNYHLHPAVSLSSTLQILSGVPKTLETSVKSYFHYNPRKNQFAIQPTYVADEKNNARLPFYIRLDFGLKKRIRKGFAAELAKFVGAKDSYFNIMFGNLLFLHRNVWLYIPMGEKEYFGIGTNYFPEFSSGYTIKF